MSILADASGCERLACGCGLLISRLIFAPVVTPLGLPQGFNGLRATALVLQKPLNVTSAKAVEPPAQGACRSNRGWLAIARSRWVLDALWVDVVAQGLVGTTAI